MGFEPAVQMWSLDRYDAEKGPEGGGPKRDLENGRKGGRGGTWQMGYPTKAGKGRGGIVSILAIQGWAKCAQWS